MSISKFPAGPKAPSFIPAGASGSYSFPEPVDAGMYLLETDTTQNIAATDLYIETSEGFRVGAAVRGGRGFISIPVAAETIYINSGTFPLPVTISKQEYSLLQAPTSASFNEYSLGDLEVLVDLPSGATDAILFWPNGTSASFSGSAASLSIPGGLSYPINVGIAAYDENAVIGKIYVSNDISQTWYEYLSSDVFIPAPGAVSADVYVLSGGGGGITSFSGGPEASGGGGGGAYSFAPAVPVSGSLSVVVGAGAAGAAGNVSSFGSASAAAGLAGTNANGGASGSGFPGGTGAAAPSGYWGGGGGGHTDPGNNGNNPPTKGGTGGAGLQLPNIFGVTVGGGGGGGETDNTPVPTGGAGVDGGGNGRSQPITATSGGSGSNGAANRGGGGGGPARAGSATGPASTGGSGRVLVKVNYS